MLHYEIIKQPKKIEEYHSEWNHLFTSGMHEPSLSLDWTWALLKTHLEDASFFLIVLRDSTQLLGIVPLCVKNVRKHGLSLATMFPIAEYFGTHSDLLLQNSSKELTDVLLDALFSVEFKWDIFRINRFIETSPILQNITQQLKNNFSFKYEIHKAEPSFFIELDNNYKNFLAKKSANFRYQLKRAAKKIHSLGEITLLRNQDYHNFDEIYPTLLSIEEKSWKHKHGTGICSTEKQREFYRELGRRAFNNGWLRLCILSLNQQPIAYEMGLVKCGKYYGVHGSYDEKFKRWNPGTVLFAKFLEDLIHDGIQEYDWFGEPFEFQKRWTDKYRWHNSLLIYNNTIKAKLFMMYNTLKNKRKQKDNDEFTLRKPRDIKPAVKK